MGLKRLSTALAALLLFSAGTALGAEISGRSSTQLLWYNDDFTEDRVIEAAQYLRLNVTKVDKDNKLSFFFYGRGAQTFNSPTDTTGRVYYLYADYRDLADKADIRLGRQFASNASGSVLMDGLKVDLKNIGPVGASAFVGRDVVFGLTGELGSSWNTDLGVSAYLTGFRSTDAEISWLRKWYQSEVARDILGASFKQNLFNSVKLYGNTKYDLFSETFIESLIGAKYFPRSLMQPPSTPSLPWTNTRKPLPGQITPSTRCSRYSPATIIRCLTGRQPMSISSAPGSHRSRT